MSDPPWPAHPASNVFPPLPPRREYHPDVSPAPYQSSNSPYWPPSNQNPAVHGAPIQSNPLYFAPPPVDSASHSLKSQSWYKRVGKIVEDRSTEIRKTYLSPPVVQKALNSVSTYVSPNHAQQRQQYTSSDHAQQHASPVYSTSTLSSSEHAQHRVSPGHPTNTSSLHQPNYDGFLAYTNSAPLPRHSVVVSQHQQTPSPVAQPDRLIYESSHGGTPQKQYVLPVHSTSTSSSHQPNYDGPVVYNNSAPVLHHGEAGSQHQHAPPPVVQPDKLLYESNQGGAPRQQQYAGHYYPSPPSVHQASTPMPFNPSVVTTPTTQPSAMSPHQHTYRPPKEAPVQEQRVLSAKPQGTVSGLHCYRHPPPPPASTSVNASQATWSLERDTHNTSAVPSSQHKPTPLGQVAADPHTAPAIPSPQFIPAQISQAAVDTHVAPIVSSSPYDPLPLGQTCQVFTDTHIRPAITSSQPSSASLGQILINTQSELGVPSSHFDSAPRQVATNIYASPDISSLQSEPVPQVAAGTHKAPTIPSSKFDSSPLEHVLAGTDIAPVVPPSHSDPVPHGHVVMDNQVVSTMPLPLSDSAPLGRAAAPLLPLSVLSTHEIPLLLQKMGHSNSQHEVSADHDSLQTQTFISHYQPASTSPTAIPEAQADSLTQLFSEMGNFKVEADENDRSTVNSSAKVAQVRRQPPQIQEVGNPRENLLHCPKDRPIYYSFSWYHLSGLSDYLICKKCYIDHIQGSVLADQFEHVRRREESVSYCGFWYPRLKEIL